jgi:hypothetical protein
LGAGPYCLSAIYFVSGSGIKENGRGFVELTYLPAKFQTRPIRKPRIEKIEIELL